MEILIGVVIALVIIGVLIAVMGELIIYFLIFLLAVGLLAGLIGGSVAVANAYGPVVLGLLLMTVAVVVVAAIIATQLEGRRLRKHEMAARESHWQNCPPYDETLGPCPTCGIAPRDLRRRS